MKRTFFIWVLHTRDKHIKIYLDRLRCVYTCLCSYFVNVSLLLITVTSLLFLVLLFEFAGRWMRTSKRLWFYSTKIWFLSTFWWCHHIGFIVSLHDMDKISKGVLIKDWTPLRYRAKFIFVTLFGNLKILSVK